MNKPHSTSSDSVDEDSSSASGASPLVVNFTAKHPFRKNNSSHTKN